MGKRPSEEIEQALNDSGILGPRQREPFIVIGRILDGLVHRVEASEPGSGEASPGRSPT